MAIKSMSKQFGLSLNQGRDLQVCTWNLAEGRNEVMESIPVSSVGFCKCSLLNTERCLLAMPGAESSQLCSIGAPGCHREGREPRPVAGAERLLLGGIRGHSHCVISLPSGVLPKSRKTGLLCLSERTNSAGKKHERVHVNCLSSSEPKVHVMDMTSKIIISSMTPTEDNTWGMAMCMKLWQRYHIPQPFTFIIITVPNGDYNLNSLLVFWSVGGNQSTRRKPTQTQGEHTNSLQMLSLVGFDNRTKVLQGYSANH
ncbi:unnamed protein product [Ranitomeya imitator]|uniref:Uncharacterized protein n=1 Tax=Ranitomeya imitator TaxID=111125 RepID=A0ABN9LHE4_9NEOB|nr:unnamed protein product [Ranitomeya imitator]